MSRLREVIPSIRRHRRAALLLLLSVELVLAGWWRRPWTLAPIQTPFDYGTGHVTVVSEHWRRYGALRHHFLPVMSIDPGLPEWPYRTAFSQEYTSVPPLAFILDYGATRLVPGVEPVLLGKLLAQLLIAASVLTAAALLIEVFGGWATLAALSFVIWSVPSLLWLANGYFALNVGMAVEFVLVAWCCFVAFSVSDDDVPGARRKGPGARLMLFSIGAALAFLGAFSDYLPLMANTIAAAGFFGLAAVTWRRRAERSRLLASGAGITVGSLAAIAATVILYGREMGFANYWRAITTRIADRSGDAPVAEHFDVIRQQMLTAWPAAVIEALIVMLGLVVVWGVVSFARRRVRSVNHPAVVVLLALAMGFGPSLFFHYRAVNYVRIHWWFAATWTIGWAITTAAFVFLAGRLGRGALLASAALLCLLVVMDVRFTRGQSADDPHADAVLVYRSLGADLPHDDLPLVVADVEKPGLFEDFPFPTAYLRRPVVLRDAAGVVRLPVIEEPHNGQPFRMGGEDVRERLLQRGGDVYVAYDPDVHQCLGTDVPLSAWHEISRFKVCRTTAAALVQNTVLGPCAGAPNPPRDFHVVSKGGGTVVVAWTASSARRYVLEAGRAPGGSDALITDLGTVTTFTASPVKPGTYYARVRARNACGTGAPSNELMVVAK